MNWLERARREISASGAGDAADTAEGPPTAVTAGLQPAVAAKPDASIDGNGSTQRWEATDSQALHEAFEERAAIMEFDGGLTREQAERAAWAALSKMRMH